MKNKNLVFGCVKLDRSPNNTIENNLKLIEDMRIINTLKGSIMICNGDFNYRDIDWETYSTKRNSIHYESKFIESIKDLFLFQHVIDPTRHREGTKSTLLR